VKYESPKPTQKGYHIFDEILSKKEIAQKSKDFIKYVALEPKALEIHLTWTRIKVRSTNLRQNAIEKPIVIDEYFD
jgi:hypothetical protein